LTQGCVNKQSDLKRRKRRSHRRRALASATGGRNNGAFGAKTCRRCHANPVYFYPSTLALCDDCIWNGGFSYQRPVPSLDTPNVKEFRLKPRICLKRGRNPTYLDDEIAKMDWCEACLWVYVQEGFVTEGESLSQEDLC
jgi:ribosomal protein L32